MDKRKGGTCLTNANIMQLNSVKQGASVTAGQGNGKVKSENVDAASAFASLMSGNYSANLSSSLVKAANAVQNVGAVDSYDRYQYKENTIDPASTTSVSDVIANSGQELEQFQEDAVTAVADQLQVTEDDVKTAMETLGLTVFDLLNPENLAQLAMQLTGETSPMDLLTNDAFQGLMQTMDQLGVQLADSIDVTPSQMDELVAQMDAYENPQPMTLEMEQALTQTTENISEETVQTASVSQQTTNTEVSQDKPVTQTEQQGTDTRNAEDVHTVEVDVTKEQKTDQQQSQNMDQQMTENSSMEDSSLENSAETSEDAQSPKTQGFKAQMTSNDVVSNTPLQGMEPEAMLQQVQEPETSFLSVDTMKLLEQVAEQIRVNVSEGISSMEMQLNPENLGKVFVNITSKEGVIHAQLAASNEAVRTALESQIADLRQNLNQAGVKVDAVEVTVASHGFEKNLEQNQQSDKQQGEREQEQQNFRRRNLSLSGLDELSGLMTEEETLAASIMRDNGNSVDMTA